MSLLAHLRLTAPAGNTALLKKCGSGGESLATLHRIRRARGLNLRPPAPEKNAFPLDPLAGCIKR